jgi:hypothetical protein
MKTHPLIIILIGLFIISIGFNILLYSENKDLMEKIKQKPKVIIIPIVPKDNGSFT